MNFPSAASELETLAGRHVHLVGFAPDGEKLFEMADALDAVRVREGLVYVTLASTESVVLIRKRSFQDAVWSERTEPVRETVFRVELKSISWEFVMRA